MDRPPPDRRGFLAQLALGASTIGVNVRPSDLAAAFRFADHAAEQSPPPPLQTLTALEARELEAIAAQIIPTDDTPGAREARVIYFMDHWFGHAGRPGLAVVREQLPQLVAQAKQGRKQLKGFADLPDAEQIAVLKVVEKDRPEFFEIVRTAAVLGMFSDPRRGGNFGKAGWKLIGFEDRYNWAAPFGYYDRA